MGYTVYAPYVFDIIMGQRVLRHGFGVYTTNTVEELNLSTYCSWDIQYMPHMYLTSLWVKEY